LILLLIYILFNRLDVRKFIYIGDLRKRWKKCNLDLSMLGNLLVVIHVKYGKNFFVDSSSTLAVW
jgi:hypothetical protein